MTKRDAALDVLRSLAPGTPLRRAVELILSQDSGALIVLGYGPDIEGICSGGFHLEGAQFSPARLAELAKMDGAVILEEGGEMIRRANVHLIPDPDIPTLETGTRHRTAERVAVQTGRPVVVVSQGRSMVTVYTRRGKHELRSPTALLEQANQNLLTLERFRWRLNEVESRLTQLEVDDVVACRDVVRVLQRAALVHHIARDLEHYSVELGGEGQLTRIQLEDLITGVKETAEQVYVDYARTFPPQTRQPLDLLEGLSTEHLGDPSRVASLLGLGPLDARMRPRGYRALNRVPRLPETVKSSLVARFGELQSLLRASVGDLDEVEGVGRARARQLRHYFDRLLESNRAWAVDEA
ncbi:MAG: DNA integrity scanning diadenylate cyclase DisA [Acidimicrobiia bacterium]|nr:DNA integrity scanning diadenylate cyclase DisA [Acidimicrobiia bacterium]